MRGIGWSLALLAATGCTSGGDVSFEHRSSLETRARGFGIHDDGSSAQVGMAGNTCEVETASGMIGMDYDVAVAEEDDVQDTVGTDTIVIGQSGTGIFTLDRNEFFDSYLPTPTVDVTDVTEARFTETGIVAVRDQAGGLTVDWYENGATVDSQNVPADVSTGGMTVDRATGTVYLPSDSGVVVVTPNGVDTTGEAGDLAAWDATAQVLYVATVGDSVLSGLEADGTVRFSTDLGSPISAVDDMGSMGAAAVMVGTNTSGAIVTVDGVTGEIRSEFATPSTADEIQVNASASVLAVRLADELHFYSINLTAE